MNKKIDNYINKEKISEEEYNLIMEIIKIRHENKLSQKDIEKLTGISQSNIARFEKNIHSASLSTVIKILDAMGYKFTIQKK